MGKNDTGVSEVVDHCTEWPWMANILVFRYLSLIILFLYLLSDFHLLLFIVMKRYSETERRAQKEFPSLGFTSCLLQCLGHSR